jgi:hypothetical protein
MPARFVHTVLPLATTLGLDPDGLAHPPHGHEDLLMAAFLVIATDPIATTCGLDPDAPEHLRMVTETI